MADVTPKNDPESTPSAAINPAQGDQQAVPGTWEDVFRHPRFTELINQKNTLQAQLDTMKTQLEQLGEQRQTAEAEREEQERKALAKKEEWQQLADANEQRAKKAEAELKAAKEELKAYSELLQPDIEARLASLPETVAPLVKPVLEGMDLLGQLRYFVANAESIKAATAPAADPAKNGNPKTPPTGVPPTPPADAQDDMLGEKAAEARQAMRQTVRSFL